MRELTFEAPDELFGPVKKLLQNLRGARVTRTRKLAEAAPPAPPAFERGELHLPTWQEVRAQEQAARHQPAS